MAAGTTAFQVNNLVWAKMAGYPFWPAIIQEPTGENLKITIQQNMKWVYFFGTHNYGFIPNNNQKLKPYSIRTKFKYRQKKNEYACQEIDQYIKTDPELRNISPYIDEDAVMFKKASYTSSSSSSSSSDEHKTAESTYRNELKMANNNLQEKTTQKKRALPDNDDDAVGARGTCREAKILKTASFDDDAATTSAATSKKSSKTNAEILMKNEKRAAAAAAVEKSAISAESTTNPTVWNTPNSRPFKLMETKRFNDDVDSKSSSSSSTSAPSGINNNSIEKRTFLDSDSSLDSWRNISSNNNENDDDDTKSKDFSPFISNPENTNNNHNNGTMRNSSSAGSSSSSSKGKKSTISETDVDVDDDEDDEDARIIPICNVGTFNLMKPSFSPTHTFTAVNQEFLPALSPKFSILIDPNCAVSEGIARSLIKFTQIFYYSSNAAQINELHQFIVENNMINSAIYCHSPIEAALNSNIIFSFIDGAKKNADEIIEQFQISSTVNALSQKIYVEMSTIQPEISKLLEEKLKEKGASYLEAMVDGNKSDAEEADLMIFAAGNYRNYMQCKPCFEQMGNYTCLLGDVAGAASTLILILKMLRGTFSAAISESFILAERAHFNMPVFNKLLNLTNLSSAYLRNKSTNILRKKYRFAEDAEETVAELKSNLDKSLKLAENFDQSIFLAEKVNELFQNACNNGNDQFDSTCLYRSTNN